MVKPAKKTPAPKPAPILRPTSGLLSGPGRTAAFAAIVFAAFVAGTVAIYWRVEQHLRSSADYTVTIDKITITPPPDWIRRDIRAEAFRTASSPDRPLSILDDDVAQRIATAFRLHPWVSDVKVEKRAAARVNVEIIYRRPACVVEIDQDLKPVDKEGVLLPSEDFSPIQKQALPCLSGIGKSPMGAVGLRWGDTRVVDGAGIASALGNVWQQLKLFRIQLAQQTPATAGVLTYELYTRSGTCIYWGYPIANAPPGEPSAEEKVARLVQYANSHGGLDGPQGIDVHSLPQVIKAAPK